jgi:hypothetical protein
MLPRIGLVSIVLVLALGCGGPGSFNGEVAGNRLAVHDAVFFPFSDTDTGEILGVRVELGDVADLCADAKALRTRKNATYVDIDVFRLNQDATWFLSPDKGTYTVIDRSAAQPPNFAYADFWRSDANCFNVVGSSNSSGRSGTVDVESIAFTGDGSITGKFDITFGSQNDKVTGSFNASRCDAPETTAGYNCE